MKPFANRARVLILENGLLVEFVARVNRPNPHNGVMGQTLPPVVDLITFARYCATVDEATEFLHQFLTGVMNEDDPA
jgi:hypothetical protein